MSDESPRVLVIEARFYDVIADELKAGALAVLEEAGARVEVVTVPGALEIPPALAMAVAAGDADPARAFDAYVLLGCVIRGETSHYDIVAGESARGVMGLAIRHRLALGNGILTVETPDQAYMRARRSGRDKGGAAAQAALALMALRRQFEGERR